MKEVLTSANIDFYLNQLSKAIEVDELEKDRRTRNQLTLDNPNQDFSYVIIRFCNTYRFIVSFTKVFHSGVTKHFVV